MSGFAGSPLRALAASALLAIFVFAADCDGSSARPPTATATSHPQSYDPARQFAASDLFDLSLLPAVGVGDWQQTASLSHTLSLALPKDWTVSAAESSVTASKPLPVAGAPGVCRTVAGWSKVDLSADPTAVQESRPGANAVRDVFEALPSNGMTVEVLQIAGSTQCGPDYGILAIIPRPPFGGQLVLNGEAFVQFPATAEDIATAFAIMGSVAVASGGGGSPVAATPVAGIGVSENSIPVGTYATMSEAIAKASYLAGFVVLPVSNLPAGFTVSFFNVLKTDFGPTFPQAPLHSTVEIGVQSDSGGLLIEESSFRMTDESGATRIATNSLGDFYQSGSSDAPIYELMTSDRTFIIDTPRANLTSEQAINILSAFH
jgi:hypothetical protein